MSIQSLSFWQQDQNYWHQSQSFYQQDQNYWAQQQNQAQATTADDALMNVMSQAMTNLSQGLSSIANQEALNRVNTQLSAAVQSALQSSSGSSSSGSSSGGASSGASSSGSSSSGSTGSSASTKNPSSSIIPESLALAEQNSSSAASILTADGVTGSLVNLLA
ncbi:MAG TPA: hypothetical protein VK430_00410 [Xanthobacteraceae bacterium]|nr:hypothetical protein [Xanthobacteraceae bacterium]